MCAADSNLQIPDTLRQRNEALHGFADRTDRCTDDDEQWADGCDQGGNTDDVLLGAFIHAVELIDKGLNLGYDLPDDGHQELAEGNRQLLQLGLQDRQLAGQVILHGICHLLGCSVAVGNRGGAFIDILLTEDRGSCRRLLRLRQISHLLSE